MPTIVLETPDVINSAELRFAKKTAIVTESVTVVNKESSNKNLQVRFTAILQSFNVLNRNGRIYPQHKMEQAVENLMHFVQNKELLGEFGHPENVVTPERLFVIHPQHVSHRIEKVWIEGNLLMGEVVTTGPWGPELARMVLDGNNVGFSGRIYVSKWDRDPETGAMIVSDDAVVRIITYDAVVIPSHKEAYTKSETVTVATEHFSHLRDTIRDYCTKSGCAITTENFIVPGTIYDVVSSNSNFDVDMRLPRYRFFKFA